MVGFVAGKFAMAAYFQRRPVSGVRDEEEWDDEKSVMSEKPVEKSI